MLLSTGLPSAEGNFESFTHDPSDREIAHYRDLFRKYWQQLSDSLGSIESLQGTGAEILEDVSDSRFESIWREICRSPKHLAWWIARLADDGYQKDHKHIRDELNGVCTLVASA